MFSLLAVSHVSSASSAGEQTLTQASVPATASVSPTTVSTASSSSQPVAQSSPTVPAAAVSSLPVTAAAATPDNPPPAQPAEGKASPFEEVPVPTDTTSFKIRLEGSEIGQLPDVPVSAKDVPPHTQIHPDEPDSLDWMSTSVYPLYSPYPSAPAQGTSAVYGHACIHHECPFSVIKKVGDTFTIHLGDLAIITTPTGTLSYKACAIGLSPKSGDAQIPTGECQHQPALILVTCHYEEDISDFNIVVSFVPVGSSKS